MTNQTLFLANQFGSNPNWFAGLGRTLGSDPNQLASLGNQFGFDSNWFAPHHVPFGLMQAEWG